ncbi:MAG: hypothetical protein L3J26_03890 [Candidatus Polarisedimenticolaceae bacterium]|nr:hypothetical protein [Candidatus Polarisedimenticolaceae bacterium]
MKLKTAFMGLLILTGALYGAAKGYIHYHVSSELDKIIPLASPFAEIRYQGISSSYEGSITVENISIYPSESNDEITIGSARIAGDGLPFLYQLMAGNFQNAPPEKFRLSVSGLSIPLDGDLAAGYINMLEEAKQVSGVKDPDGCGVMTGLSLDLLGALGFYSITMDAALDVDLDSAAGRAETQLEFDLQGVGYSQTSLLLSHLPQPGIAMAEVEQPRLSEMSVVYQIDPDFVVKARQYCATSRSLTVDAFIASMLDMDEKQLVQQLGFIPGPGLIAAIKHFIKDPREVSFSIHPAEAIDLATLSFYKPEELPEILNLKLAVNGEPVTDLSFSLPVQTAKPGARASGLASQLSNAKTAFSSDAGAAKKLKRPIPAREYVPTPIDQLHNYMDRGVRIYIDQENAMRKGVLVSITKDQITIKQRLSGGDMTVQVPLRQISRAEVYRRP